MTAAIVTVASVTEEARRLYAGMKQKLQTSLLLHRLQMHKWSGYQVLISVAALLLKTLTIDNPIIS
jgi:hypothetical protein